MSLIVVVVEEGSLVPSMRKTEKAHQLNTSH